MTDQPSPKDFTFKSSPSNGRHDGWTVDKQKRFLETLAETGCVSHAASEAGMSAQSAYRFRLKPEAENFLKGWKDALQLASTRLVAIAYDRAINGVIEETYKDGEVLSARRRYSDKLLMFLISNVDALHFGKLATLQQVIKDPVDVSRGRIAGLIDKVEPENREGFGEDGDMAAEDNDAAV